MNDTVILIILPLIAGVLLFILPEKAGSLKGVIALVVSLIAGYFAVVIYGAAEQLATPADLFPGATLYILGSDIFKSLEGFIVFNIDRLSKLIILFTSLFSTLILLYSLIYIKNKRVRNYYPFFLITISCTYGALLSENLLVFLAFWGILGITLYKLIPGKSEESSAAAKKTLILIGASDTIMILGIALIWRITGSLNMTLISVPTLNIVSVVAFLALITGSFTKAGAFPFHTWVPDYAREAPASSSALLPASLDKLLGIYFLARITTDLFILSDLMAVILLATGVISIIAAVMMALMQHNYKRLLGFHAVSQVGYMILGFGLGSAIGVAAGLFHMLNNAIYKSGLLLTAGCIEYRTGKENLDDVGGLSGAMPVTCFSAIIFALSISGIPPLNGFASKWMIYQGIIDFGSGPGIANKLWVLWLGLAVLGSALTLASFIKFIGGIFMGRRRAESESIKEVPFTMWLPPAILALLCIFFGVFATKIIVPGLIMPVTGEFEFTGFWNSSFVSVLVLGSMLFGLLIYFIVSAGKFRREDSFIGGEKIQEQASYPVLEFYKTLGEIRFLSWMYRKAEERRFDIYELSKRFVLWVSHNLSVVHTGVLPSYVIWAFAGLVIMLLIMIK